VDQAEGGVQAMELLRSKSYDCMILDLGLMDFDGDELLRRASGDDGIDLPPVIIHTSRDLSWEENIDLRAYSDAIIIKDVRSHERLLDEVSLFLHQVVADMPETKRQVITNLHDTDVLLRGKTVLVVDDDMRALFALSRLLSEREMKVLKADNGEKALEILEAEDGIDIVLMDIMMPVLDGYETMRRLRANPKLAQMPVIALTAKAMKGDQDKCIEAGASDYLPKPVDQDRLISMLRVWLYR
jgi:CheY-like chemotaxis protein